MAVLAEQLAQTRGKIVGNLVVAQHTNVLVPERRESSIVIGQSVPCSYAEHDGKLLKDLRSHTCNQSRGV
jgi:hypothetical protein